MFAENVVCNTEDPMQIYRSPAYDDVSEATGRKWNKLAEKN